MRHIPVERFCAGGVVPIDAGETVCCRCKDAALAAAAAAAAAWAAAAAEAACKGESRPR